MTDQVRFIDKVRRTGQVKQNLIEGQSDREDDRSV